MTQDAHADTVNVPAKRQFDPNQKGLSIFGIMKITERQNDGLRPCSCALIPTGRSSRSTRRRRSFAPTSWRTRPDAADAVTREQKEIPCNEFRERAARSRLVWTPPIAA
jgi:hypothetical protein